jgi:membrane-associated phospholipid phosphatase
MPFLIDIVLALIVGLAAMAIALRYPARTAAAGGDVVPAVAARHPGLRGWLRRRRDPEEVTGLALTLGLLMLLGGGLVVTVVWLLVRSNDAVHDLDSGAADFGHDHATHASTRLLTWVTNFGDWYGVVPVLIVVLVLEWHRSRRGLPLAILFVTVVIAGDQLVTNGIKALVDRARPTLNPLAATLGPSFPSGHSSTAACVYAAVALVLARGRGPRVRALLVGGAVAITVAVAASRVLLDFHWVSDVIAGVALGWAWFALCAIAFGGRLLRLGAPVERAQRGLSGAKPGDTRG